MQIMQLNEVHFRIGMIDEANALVRRFHYSARPPGNVQIVGTWHEDGGLFGGDGAALAACFFSIPPTRWTEDVFELSRLVRDERVVAPLTGLISSTANFIRKKKLCDLLVSFADTGFGHHGGIYQAASWNYDGRREPSMDGILWNGKFIPGRSCNSRWGTRSVAKLKQILGSSHEIEPHFDAGKHLYWKALSRSGSKKAGKLNLKSLPYPKPKLSKEAA
jgi:hypothetical protein